MSIASVIENDHSACQRSVFSLSSQLPSSPCPSVWMLLRWWGIHTWSLTGPTSWPSSAATARRGRQPFSWTVTGKYWRCWDVIPFSRILLLTSSSPALCSYFLYPNKLWKCGDATGDDSAPASGDGKYELLTVANDLIAEEIKSLMERSESSVRLVFQGERNEDERAVMSHTHTKQRMRELWCHTHTQNRGWESCDVTHTHKTEDERAVMSHTHTHKTEDERAVMSHTHTCHKTEDERAVMSHTHTQNRGWESCDVTHTQNEDERAVMSHTHTQNRGWESCDVTHTKQGWESCDVTHTHRGLESCDVTHTKRGWESCDVTRRKWGWELWCHTHKTEDERAVMSHTHTQNEDERAVMSHTHTEDERAVMSHTHTEDERAVMSHTHTHTQRIRELWCHTHTHTEDERAVMSHTHTHRGLESCDVTHTHTQRMRELWCHTHTEQRRSANLKVRISMHPSSSAYPRSGRGGSSSSRVSQTSLFPAALTGGSRGVPRPVRRYSPSSWTSVYPVASSQLDVPGTPP